MAGLGLFFEPFVFNVSSAPSYPLDNLSSSAKTTATGLFSPKRLLTTYTGPTVNIRSSAGPTSDFYADSSQNLWTGPGGTGTTYASFIGANTGFVTKWYDQSGVGNHATQGTTTLQPSLATNGTFGYCLDFTSNSGNFVLPNTTIPSGNSSYTISWKNGYSWSIAGTTTRNVFTVVFGGNNSGTGYLNGCVLASTGGTGSTNYFSFYDWWNSNDKETILPGNIQTLPADAVFTETFNSSGGVRSNYYQGSSIWTASGYSHNTQAVNNYICNSPYFGGYNHPLKCVSVFSSSISTADKTILEAQ
jgi:hypothetical protein